MLPKKNPAALSGADREGIRYAGQQSFTRDSLKRQAQQRLRRQHLITALHRLGARATFEFISEIAGRFGIEQHVDDRLEAYASRLTPQLLRLTGGDKFPALPMRAVWGRR
jgi:hypothetical protein